MYHSLSQFYCKLLYLHVIITKRPEMGQFIEQMTTTSQDGFTVTDSKARFIVVSERRRWKLSSNLVVCYTILAQLLPVATCVGFFKILLGKFFLSKRQLRQ